MEFKVLVTRHTVTSFSGNLNVSLVIIKKILSKDYRKFLLQRLHLKVPQLRGSKEIVSSNFTIIKSSRFKLILIKGAYL